MTNAQHIPYLHIQLKISHFSTSTIWISSNMKWPVPGKFLFQWYLHKIKPWLVLSCASHFSKSEECNKKTSLLLNKTRLWKRANMGFCSYKVTEKYLLCSIENHITAILQVYNSSPVLLLRHLSLPQKQQLNFTLQGHFKTKIPCLCLPCS